MEYGTLFPFLVENSLELIVVFNKQGEICYANNTALHKLGYERLEGTIITQLFPDLYEVCNFNGLMSSDSVIEEKNLVVYRRNNTCFPAKVRIFAYSLTGSIGREGHFFAQLGSDTPETVYIMCVQDVSVTDYLEKRVDQVGREAEDALRVKSEFVANVTHELRTPVNGILGNTKALLEIETQKDKLGLLQLIERGCKDMNAIINNILDFSKLEAGKFVLEPREFSFTDMMEYVKGNHKNNIVEKGLTFTITVSPQIPETIIGDELRIVQVLNNLISNAYKFTSAGGIHVEVLRTAHENRRVELFFMVMDTGVGIAEKDMDKLFKSFSQVDASVTRKYGGTGLGLNISKQLVELMGGSINVESIKHKGTTFSFNIWVDLPEDVSNSETEDVDDKPELFQKLLKLSDDDSDDKIWIYGEEANKKEIEKRMSKLILCVDMENWEKAEMFLEGIKSLTAEAPREIQNAVFKLKMATQKGDYDKTIAAYDNLKKLI